MRQPVCQPSIRGKHSEIQMAAGDTTVGATPSRTCHSSPAQVEDVPDTDTLIRHLSPIGREHVNLTGDYIWGADQKSTKSHAGLQPLRPVPDTTTMAA